MSLTYVTLSPSSHFAPATCFHLHKDTFSTTPVPEHSAPMRWALWFHSAPSPQSNFPKSTGDAFEGRVDKDRSQGWLAGRYRPLTPGPDKRLRLQHRSALRRLRSVALARFQVCSLGSKGRKRTVSSSSLHPDSGADGPARKPGSTCHSLFGNQLATL